MDEVQGKDGGDAAVFGQHTGGGASKSMPEAARSMLANPFGAAAANLQTTPLRGVGRSLRSDLLAQGAAFPYSTPVLGKPLLKKVGHLFFGASACH